MEYAEFLERKTHIDNSFGFSPVDLPDFLFDFQKHLVDWSLRKGRSALFCDCGLGKTPMELVWADNVARKTNGNVLILAPLAVSYQFLHEAEKFGIELKRSIDGKHGKGLVVTNYERLQHFDPNDFSGVVCDESSRVKNCNSKTSGEVNAFMRKIPYRLLATATAAPNDFHELGTSSEILGNLGNMDMLNKFFKNDQNNSAVGRKYGEVVKWRFKGHSERDFWRWVCSWARAVRRPSDIGFCDDRFHLPGLTENEHIVDADTLPEGFLFSLPAVGMAEQRDECRRTMKERCEKVAELVNNTGQPALVWCHLNPEGDMLQKMIPDAVQVSGRDSDDAKEEKLWNFSQNKYRVMITKYKIGAWGLNLQHCNHVVTFPSHSYEQYYQGIRRCWRFGQTRPVTVDIVTTEGEKKVMENMKRKAEQADRMFANIVELMKDSLVIKNSFNPLKKEEVPPWLSSIK